MKKFFQERPGEKIGGGFFVFRRHASTGRIFCNTNFKPFEHPDLNSAIREANRLSKMFPGQEFGVHGVLFTCVVEQEQEAAA